MPKETFKDKLLRWWDGRTPTPVKPKPRILLWNPWSLLALGWTEKEIKEMPAWARPDHGLPADQG
jgi:hypothetical protein